MSANKSNGLASLGVIGVGVVAYVALLVIQLLTWWGNGGIFNLVSLLILAQIALAWPFVGHLFLGRPLGSVLNYAICFTAAVGVLAVSGNLGIPKTETDADRKTAKFILAERKLAEKEGGLKARKLAVDRAAAKDEEAKKKVQEKIDELDKSMSAADKEKLARAKEVLRKKKDVSEWATFKRAYNIHRSQPVNGLIAVSAFAVLLGALGGGIGSVAPKPDKPAPDPAPEPEKAAEEKPPKKKAASKKKAATKKAAKPVSE